MSKINGIGKELYAIIFTDFDFDIELWFANDRDHLYELVKDDYIENLKIKDDEDFDDDIWGMTLIPKYLMKKNQIEGEFCKLISNNLLYYSLYLFDDEDPDPYTFNTNSIEDIRNYLVWKFIDLKTGGKVSIIGNDYFNYNISEINWEQYAISVKEIYKTIDKIYLKFSDNINGGYKSLKRYSETKLNKEKFYFYTIEIDLINFGKCELFISEKAFENATFTQDLNNVQHLFGIKPWNSLEVKGPRQE